MINHPIDDKTLALLKILSQQTVTLLNEHQTASVDRKRAIMYEVERLRLKRESIIASFKK
ncbi:hypothetical protein FHR92_004160 [Fontibacillus solani]|uniref:Uncharacterized protein n=1 Tax=Fontibacillus solani TaxID=1572857 RepID=A0A7W3SWS2_9BACL|nr:hypothetical protein [Fontibacillus solani]MBA9087675.1 hypothetical protein [Fontibacillus solani]